MTESQRDAFLYQIAAYQDGGLSATELAEFDLALRRDAAKMRLFIEVQKRSAVIVELSRQAMFSVDASSPLPASSGLPRFISPGLALLAIAACIAMWTFVPTGETDAPLDIAKAGKVTILKAAEGLVPDGCAVITYASLTHWEGSHVPESDTYLKYRSRYHLRTGSTRFEMSGGAIVSVAAPASFSILDASTLELTTGKLTARLPEQADELVVRAGEMEVRDLGTAFGLTAESDGRVNVAVFDGSVAARLRNESLEPDEQTFGEGKSFSLASSGTALSEVPYAPELYRDIWPLAVGINDVSDLIEFVPPGLNQKLDSLADDHKLFLVAERLNRYVDQDFGVDFLGAGQSWPTSQNMRHKVGHGRTVSSFLLVYQPEPSGSDRRVSLSGSITFQHEILGVAVEDRQLRRTDNVFGVPRINYASFKMRSLENIDTEEGQLPADSLWISDDGRQLHFHLHVGAGKDHIRILVNDGDS